MKELLAIQDKLKAPKGQFNSFGKYKYRSAEDILEAVKPLCVEQNALLTLSDEMVAINERYYIKATVTLKTGKDSISVTAYARESENKKGMDDSQITGTASSYARKYALNGLFLIDDTKDADTDEYHKKTNKPAKPKNEQSKSEFDGLNEQQAKDLAIKKGLANTLKSLKKPENIEFKPQIMQVMCKKYKVDKWGDIKFDDYNKFIKEVKAELEKQKQEKEVGF